MLLEHPKASWPGNERRPKWTREPAMGSTRTLDRNLIGANLWMRCCATNRISAPPMPTQLGRAHSPSGQSIGRVSIVAAPVLTVAIGPQLAGSLGGAARMTRPALGISSSLSLRMITDVQAGVDSKYSRTSGRKRVCLQVDQQVNQQGTLRPATSLLREFRLNSIAWQ